MMPRRDLFVSTGLDKIEYLQNHESQEIYQKAFDIIERYFGTEEQEDVNIAPAMVSGDQMLQFGFGTTTLDPAANTDFRF
jgi:Atypical Arm repeat